MNNYWDKDVNVLEPLHEKYSQETYSKEIDVDASINPPKTFVTELQEKLLVYDFPWIFLILIMITKAAAQQKVFLKQVELELFKLFSRKLLNHNLF